MKHLKMLGLAAVAAAALMAFVGAGTASATELYSGETTLPAGTSIHATLEPESTALLQSTSKALTDTCTESTVAGETANASGAQITGAIESLTWGNCAFTTHTDEPGELQIAWTSGNDGTVTGSGSTVTVTISGTTCLYGTGTGTHLGTAKGTTEGNATLSITAVINELGTKKILCPDTTTWTANYIVTSPSPLRVAEK